jgi:hypothetical protein
MIRSPIAPKMRPTHILTPQRVAVTTACRAGTLGTTSWCWLALPSWQPANVPSPGRRDARDVTRRLLLRLPAVLSPIGEVVIDLDDTIERRWGGNIEARGIYRDPVGCSNGPFVKTSG